MVRHQRPALNAQAVRNRIPTNRLLAPGHCSLETGDWPLAPVTEGAHGEFPNQGCQNSGILGIGNWPTRPSLRLFVSPSLRLFASRYAKLGSPSQTGGVS